MSGIPNVLTIAGSDPSGGAGIQADHKTFSAHGVYGCSVITACTSQNTHGVTGVHPIPPDFVGQQLATLTEDVSIQAAKTGMLASPEVIDVVASTIKANKLGLVVIDPVMVSTSGHRLVPSAAEASLRDHLLPLADMVTPNLPEARVLTGLPENAASTDLMKALRDLGAKSVYLKGGHSTDPKQVVDLFWDGDATHELVAARIDSMNTHGTGCSLAASLASNLALGFGLCDAAERSHAWLHRAISLGSQLMVGSGHGPVFHHHSPELKQ